MTKNRNDESAARRVLRLSALVLFALAVVALGVLHWRNQVSWPEFPPSTNGPLVPSAVLKLERDYGWRTGDSLPVELYIKQQPGTEVDSRIAVTGDFEVRGQPSAPHVRVLADGTKLLLVRFNLQSFNYGDVRTMGLRLSYKSLATGVLESVDVPPMTVHISKTYDGRAIVQPNNFESLSLAWDIWVNIGLFLLMIFLFALSGRFSLMADAQDAPVVSATNPARLSFDSAWSRIQAGEQSSDIYEELERIIRQMYGLEPQTRGQIEQQFQAGKHRHAEDVTTIIGLCDKRLYDHKELTVEEHREIHEAFTRIFWGKPKPRPAPKPLPKQPPEDGTAPPGGDAGTPPSLPGGDKALIDVHEAAPPVAGTGDNEAGAKESAKPDAELPPEGTASASISSPGPASPSLMTVKVAKMSIFTVAAVLVGAVAPDVLRQLALDHGVSAFNLQDLIPWSIASVVAAGYWLLAVLRQTGSRWLAACLGAVLASTIYGAQGYGTDVLLSFAGWGLFCGLTVAAVLDLMLVGKGRDGRARAAS